MPISRNEFDQGRIDLALAIAHSLATSAHLAFTVEEVSLLLLDTEAREVTPDVVKEVLESLASEGQVRARRLRASGSILITKWKSGIWGFWGSKGNAYHQAAV